MTPQTTVKPPELEKSPKPCLPCDLMVSLGLISATCETLPQSERNKCHQLMKPLEDRKANPASVLADIIVLTGDTNLNDTLDRMNLIIYQATQIAKEKLIAAGKLTKEGVPIG